MSEDVASILGIQPELAVIDEQTSLQEYLSQTEIGNLNSGWPATSGLARWAITAETTLYENADIEGPVVSALKPGDEADFAYVETVASKKWCKLALQSGVRGYVPGDTKIRQLFHVGLEQARTTVYSAPDATSAVVREITKGTKYLLLGTFKWADKDWVKIRCDDGVEGFIDGGVKIKKLDTNPAPKTGNTPEHDMMVGGAWCIGGIVVTAATYNSAAQSGGGHYFIAWGAIVFGGAQFLKGLVRMVGVEW